MLPSYQNQSKEIHQLKAQMKQLQQQVKLSSVCNNDDSDSNDSHSHLDELSDEALIHRVEESMAELRTRKDFM